MTRYLLDTNIISALMRDPSGPAAARLREVGADKVCTSLIVAAELRYRARRRDSAPLTAALEAVLASLDVLPLEPPLDGAYAEIRAALEAEGTPIGANDLLIAAHAKTSGCTLVTDDQAFARVPGLSVENWLR